MKIPLILICSFLWCSGDYVDVFAQDFFPLEIGNLWRYDVYGEQGNHYTSKMQVIGDTTLTNGKSYYILDSYDWTLGPLVRVDSQFIYFVMENDTAEMPLYKTDAQLGDTLHVNWGAYFYVYITGIDSITMFDSATVIYTFLLDGLQVSIAKYSKDFGPVSVEHYGDPPSPFPFLRYQLSGCIISGNVSGVVNSLNDDEAAKPKGFDLQQNYPNPFNATTTIRFGLPEANHAKLEIYNVMGQKIQTLLSKYMDAGNYSIQWDSKNYQGVSVSSGIYIYKILAGGFFKIKKMLFMK